MARGSLGEVLPASIQTLLCDAHPEMNEAVTLEWAGAHGHLHQLLVPPTGAASPSGPADRTAKM